MKKIDLSKRKRQEDEKPKGPRQRALLTVEEYKQHLRIKGDLERQMHKKGIPDYKKRELGRQLRNICSEMHEHWKTMPRNPAEDYSAFPRA